MDSLSFYKGKSVFITGHTGFKGAWLCKILCDAGARVTGYALDPNTAPNLYDIIGIGSHISSIIGDVRDFPQMERAYRMAEPEVVFHLAAQPLVRDSYLDPLYTYETNVMGTVNVLECIRRHPVASSFVNVTTDKVYLNRELKDYAYQEDDPLDGFDPYSNSKSCSDLVTHSYANSFFAEKSCALSTARAGNVIGGGDFAKVRIIPDCVRAKCSDNVLVIRNPDSVRPYQHVLEPLFAYLRIAHKQYVDPGFAGWYNIGPDKDDCLSTRALVEAFSKSWGEPLDIRAESPTGAHEARFLMLDNTRIKDVFGWNPCYTTQQAIEKTVEWTKAWSDGQNMSSFMTAQIEDFKSRVNYA
jgi:CDP-glucose 4,6-dehydratase